MANVSPLLSVSRIGSSPLSVEEIHAVMRHDIIVLRLKPGERMSENELGRQFGISRTPIREALFRLVEEGLVEVMPQRGSFVTRISMRAVRRARFVREALEVSIIRQAAERGLSPAQLRHLDEVIGEQEQAREAPELFTRADDRFHRALAEGIEMGDIWSVVEREKAQFDRLRFLSLPNVTPVDTLIAQHKAMLAAVRANDVPGAERAARQHLSEVLKVADALAATHPGLIINDI